MRLRNISVLLILLVIGVFASPYLIRAGKWVIAFNRGLERAAESQKTGSGPDALTPEEAERVYLSPGNPSNASQKEDNFLLVNSAYALSYNSSKGIANWVAWRLSKTDMGDAERQNDFRPDSRLRGGLRPIDPRDYSSSGYERGHLCPSADRSSSPAINSETFLMTNIAPQVHGLNSGPWEKLERYSRSMARRDANLYIIAGQYGTKGKIDGRLTIPARFWKVIVVIENGGDISSADANTRVIAVDMPNENGILNANWRDFTVTVRSIEEKTGYDLLSNLPRKLQDVLETRTDPRSER